MNKIDYKARLKNKYFIASCLAFAVLLIKTFTNFQLPENTDALLNTLLTVLTGLGILIDPLTPGVGDAPDVPVERQ